MSDWKINLFPPTPHPFANAISSDEWVLISGLGGHTADGGIADSAVDQAAATFANLSAQLQAEGSSLDEVVWIRPIVSAREHIAALDDACRAHFGDTPPASAALLICELADPRMKVEIEAWAHRGARRADRGN